MIPTSQVTSCNFLPIPAAIAWLVSRAALAHAERAFREFLAGIGQYRSILDRAVLSGSRRNLRAFAAGLNFLMRTKTRRGAWSMAANRSHYDNSPAIHGGYLTSTRPPMARRADFEGLVFRAGRLRRRRWPRSSPEHETCGFRISRSTPSQPSPGQADGGASRS
jgi:hypothetical protein